MINECAAHLCLIHTTPKQENRVALILRAWDVETFASRMKEQRYSHVGTPGPILKPLFHRYIFAIFKAYEFHKVRFTRGVHHVVNFGGKLIAIGDELIVIIRHDLIEAVISQSHYSPRSVYLSGSCCYRKSADSRARFDAFVTASLSVTK
jgi:hypothetical protein